MIHFFLQRFMFIVIHLLSEYSICVILKGWGPADFIKEVFGVFLGTPKERMDGQQKICKIASFKGEKTNAF